MRVLRLRSVAWLLLCMMVLVTGCLFDQAKDKESKETGGAKKDSKSQQGKLPPPPMKLEEILANKEEGSFAGDRYDEKAVQEQLQQMPEGLSTEEIYAYLLSLVGESYVQLRDTYESLENPNYRQEMLELDPNAPAEGGANLKVEVLLDSSGSMAGSVPGGVKMDLAKQAIQEFMAKLPAGSQVGLRVFGHKGSNSEQDKADSCAHTELVYPIGSYDEKAFTESLQRFSPRGWTPLTSSLNTAQQDLSAQKEEGAKYIIYLVSDGIETCGGDPVAAARSLHESDIKAIVNIIGFDVDDAAQQQLKEAAAAGGGSYVTVTNQRELQKAFQAELDALAKQNQEWSGQAHERIKESFSKDSDLLSKTYCSMSDTYNREKSRLWDAAYYLKKDQDRINHEEWSVINKWVKNRWKLLYDYSNEKSRSISGKTLDEDSDSAHEVIEQRGENIDKISEEK